MTTPIAPKPPRPLPVQPSLARLAEAPSKETFDRYAWDLLCSHRQSVLNFLSRRCRDLHQAEDIAHDTLIKAARYRESLRHVTKPVSWLMQIAANMQRDHVRRELRHQLVPPGDSLFMEIPGTEPIPGDVPEASYYSVDGDLVASDRIVREVRAAWQAMSVNDRTVLSGYYRQDGSTVLAARNCGIDRSLVKIRLFRARKRLETSLRRRLGTA